MLKRALEGILTNDESEELFSAFDQIGDIIVIRIPEPLLSKKKIIGETLLEKVSTAKSVFYQSSDVEGDFRTRTLELVAGDNRTETEYKEFGCRFVVDVEKAFFSPRLSTERERIASLVQDSEIVINMFGGVGMFSISPKGLNKTEIWVWAYVDRAAPAQVKDAMRLASLRSFSPAGTFEQDDMDNWQGCTESSRGAVSRRYSLNMQMGLGHERFNEELGAWASDFRMSDSNHRHFYRRWLELMNTDTVG